MEEKLNVLINAYAVSPAWGSEPGMGWNWVSNLARYCNLYVITEGEWKKEIDIALESHPFKDNLHFYYLPVSDNIRKKCWNQGDWRFYYYYRKWQKRAFKKAVEIVKGVHIDIIHHLNMIGFREPGLLWKIDGYKYVWGPVGGMETMPITYLKGVSTKTALFNRLKNTINTLQYRYQPNVRKAMRRANAVIAATSGCQCKIMNYYHKDIYLLNETGCYLVDKTLTHKVSSDVLNILWVGKYDFRKQLGLAIKVIAEIKDLNIKLKIAGEGEQAPYKALAIELGVEDKIEFLGRVNHDEMNTLMQGSDIFLFTSIMDATSTVVMEAMQNQLPIVCFDTCGFGTVVDETIGVKIPLSNPEQSVQDFACAIRKLYNERNLLSRMSNNCKERVKEFEWDFKAQRMVEIYKSVLDN